MVSSRPPYSHEHEFPQCNRLMQRAKFGQCIGNIRFQDAELAVLPARHQCRAGASDDIGADAKVNIR